MRRRLRAALALACAAGALCAAATSSAQSPPSIQTAGGGSSIARGRALFVDGCSNCHGFQARGKPGVAPSLRGVGALAADFYLSTGRMPLAAIGDEPVRSKPAYDDRQIRDLVSYIGSFGGPAVPQAHPASGSLSEGQQVFADRCAGCHQIVGQGGMVTGASVPDLQSATPRQIAEAIRIGPYAMPRFNERQIDSEELDSLSRYVVSTRDPDDRGGWGIGHLGPIPEGMVAWLLGLAALLLTARIIGERTTR
jgi:ubiquinol-cytochrome c reductase cytochrome c subunit